MSFLVLSSNLEFCCNDILKLHLDCGHQLSFVFRENEWARAVEAHDISVYLLLKGRIIKKKKNCISKAVNNHVYLTGTGYNKRLEDWWWLQLILDVRYEVWIRVEPIDFMETLETFYMRLWESELIGQGNRGLWGVMGVSAMACLLMACIRYYCAAYNTR